MQIPLINSQKEIDISILTKGVYIIKIQRKAKKDYHKEIYQTLKTELF